MLLINHNVVIGMCGKWRNAFHCHYLQCIINSACHTIIIDQILSDKLLVISEIAIVAHAYVWYNSCDYLQCVPSFIVS